MSRLAQQYGDMHRALGALTDAEQQSVAERLVEAALSANGLCAADAGAHGAVERLDELAWHVQEQLELGRATPQEYEAAFRRARAASSAQMLSDPTALPEDVVYEAVHGLPSVVEALALIKR